MGKLKTTPILDGAYEVIGLVPGPCGSRLGTVDLSKLTPALAQKLVDINFPYLRKAKPKPGRKKNPEPEEPEADVTKEKTSFIAE